jgi:hypothetical protein
MLLGQGHQGGVDSWHQVDVLVAIEADRSWTTKPMEVVELGFHLKAQLLEDALPAGVAWRQQ